MRYVYLFIRPSQCYAFTNICNEFFSILEQYTLERGAVHACHAGGVVHLLEGWTHHEVGAVDVDQIDVVWEAALRHGFKPC